MKNLHIMFNEKFISSYIKFVNDNLDMNEHYFIVIGGVSVKKMPIPEYLNVRYISFEEEFNIFLKFIKQVYILYHVLLKEAKNSEQVYFHGLFHKKTILFLYIFRKLLKKSNWIVWGGDLYCFQNRNYESLKNRIWYKIDDYVKGNIEYVNTLVPGDYDIAKRYYNVKGKYKEMRYPCELVEMDLDKFKIVNKRETYIQVGNSGNPSNNHLEVLKCLEKYKDFDIKIFAVLSYAGTKEYVNKVKNYGEKLFGSKFIAIMDFMPYEKYWEYLSNIDILIFNHKRQQGLGNIVMLSYFEKKIYLRSDISSWDYLTGNIGLRLNDYAQIQNKILRNLKIIMHVEIEKNV